MRLCMHIRAHLAPLVSLFLSSLSIILRAPVDKILSSIFLPAATGFHLLLPTIC